MTSSTEAIFNNPSPAQLQVKSESTDHHVSFCSPSTESLFVKSENDSKGYSSHSLKNISSEFPRLTSLDEQEVCVKEEIVEIEEVNTGLPVKSYEISIPVEVTNENKDFIKKTLKSKTGVQNISHLVLMTSLNGPSGSSETCDGGNELGKLGRFQDYSARTTDRGSVFFTCGKCKFESISRHLLKQHYKKVHISELYSCEHCNRLYLCKLTLRQHRSIHHSSRVFSCSKCNFTSSNKNTLIRHRRQQHGRYYSCDYCNFRTKTNSLLVVHKFNKHQIQPSDMSTIECKICNKVFLFLSTFDRHQRIHTGERPFSCNLCDYKTSRYPVLNAHKLKHFRCPHCKMGHIDQKSLDDHVSAIHMIHRCSICPFRSSRKKDLFDHKLNVHRNDLSKEDLYPFQCEKCLKAFSRNRTLTRHKKLSCKFKSGGSNESGQYGKRKNSMRFKSGAAYSKSGEDVKDEKEVHVCHACNEQFPAFKVLTRHLKYCVFNS